jgi:hypothetical protein
MAIRICAVDECENEISDGCGSQGGLPVCHRCRGWYYLQRKKGPKAFAARRAVLNYHVRRADYLSTYIGRQLKAASARVAKARAHAKDVHASTHH